MRYKDPFLIPIMQISKKKKLRNEEKIQLIENIFQKIIKFTGENREIRKKIEEIRKIIAKSGIEINKEINNLNNLNDLNNLNNLNKKLNFSLDERKSNIFITPYHLSLITSICSTDPKSNGEFNTPFYIAEYLAERAIKYYLTENKAEEKSDNKTEQSKLLRLKFADIASGTGNLILALLYKLKERIKKEEEIENEELIEFISNNIYCYDNNQLALKINELRLFLFIKFTMEEAELRKVNFKTIKTNTLDKEKIKKNNYFDIILINPPFKTYGLRNGQKYSQELKNYLRKEYKTAEYKLPLYPLFMERAIELLRKRGVLGVVSPDSFLLGKYYSKIRSYILNNTTIKEITLLDYEPFEKVTLGRTALSFYMKKNEKEKKQNQIITKKISNYQTFTHKNEIDKKYLNNEKKFLKNDLNRFFLFFNEKEEKIVEKWIEKADCKLEDLVTIHTGIRSKIGQKKIISLKKHDENWKKGILSGKQIKPFYLEYKGHWINVDPTILWAGGYNEEIIENPKLLIRQTGDKIIACVDTNGYYHLNNIHSLSPKDETVDLYSLSVILNSKEFNQVYRILSMEKKRTFAQIDIDFFLKMPIIYFSKEKKTLYEFYLKESTKQKKRIEIESYLLDNI
ncbi:MAG: hypothetical protein K9W45_03625 [Candidatus Heimdallarchaeum aukensis]|uniref:site-specific DNA-methyltransferase (adenine-specific) n=1 Tax=Candidatus Heimdallarchaeum aukensis TaxID=2876573 RepID=A0A9Y1FLD2_9ARCH|nr:MAG: hypothetical protein K9W45_03625 [Candidatus Heimdallarchaeum aukensis]